MTAARSLALIARADRTWQLEEQASLLVEAVSLAREADDLDAEYAARMRLVPNSAIRFEVSEAVTHLAWCVVRHDSDPTRFPRRASGTEDLLYLEDWTLRQLALSDALSPVQVEDLIAEHARRLGPGAGEHALGTLGALHAWALGDVALASAHIGAALRVPGDGLAHCVRCTRDIAAQIAEAAGDAAAVVMAVDDFATDPCDDLDQPASALSRGLFAWLASDRREDADSAYGVAVRRVAARPTTAEVRGRLARYALVTGRLDEAVGHVEAALPYVHGSALATHLRLGALREIAAVLAGLQRRGLGERCLTGVDVPSVRPLLPARGEGWTVATAAPVVLTAARELAGRFDARAGTMFHVEQLQRTVCGAESQVPGPLL
ncbi:hypothetical protein RN607_14155 [Demequina capsici]|uniref:Uncharacterized protein n=1 Tax=Demequina capsici TaxID=3075620 RepID=A0AA96FDB1_9MICO|nr:hypothetical protein [Demequina sp. PMTSA13]WNM27325.1 hypothetical protein RN607_14155 [Demequina sp. PMTSA13]